MKLSARGLRRAYLRIISNNKVTDLVGHSARLKPFKPPYDEKQLARAVRARKEIEGTRFFLAPSISNRQPVNALHSATVLCDTFILLLILCIFWRGFGFSLGRFLGGSIFGLPLWLTFLRLVA